MAQVSSESRQSRNSFQKILRAAVAETRVHKKLWIITLVLYGVAFLLFVFNSYCYESGRFNAAINDYEQVIEYIPSGVGSLFAAVGVLVGFFAALSVFRDMNNQQLCDISMALPLRAGERFFSRLLSLFFVQVAPLLVSTVLGNALALLVVFGQYGELPKVVCGGTGLFGFVLLFLAASLFIMAITVLCACCCGAVAESAYFSLILMFIINVLPPSFFNFLYNTCAGYSTGFFHYTYEGHDFCKYWGFLYLFSTDEEKMPLYCLVGSLISIAVMLLSGLIYRKRDARTVGNPIASRVFFEIFLFFGCVTVLSFYVYSNETLWGILFAGVIYFIINLIVSRAKIGVKKILLWVGKYLATSAVCIAVLSAASVTGGFGAIALRPETRYLEGARFSINCYYAYDTGIVTDPLSAEQAEQVMAICKKHLLAGRKEIGASMIWGIRPESSGRVAIRVYSNVTYPERPFPQWQFVHHYVRIKMPDTQVETANGGGVRIDGGYTEQPDGTYTLDFWQNVKISDAEAVRMMEELLALDFVHLEEKDSEIRAEGIDTESYEGPLDPAGEYA